jgi:hypothetical protein
MISYSLCQPQFAALAMCVWHTHSIMPQISLWIESHSITNNLILGPRAKKSQQLIKSYSCGSFIFKMCDRDCIFLAHPRSFLLFPKRSNYLVPKPHILLSASFSAMLTYTFIGTFSDLLLCTSSGLDGISFTFWVLN